MADDDETPLVARAQAGDLDAFDLLVRRHQDWVFNLLVRLTGNPQDAEDLAQETFLSAFRAIKRFTNTSKFSTWLYAIAANAARSRARHLAVVRRAGERSLDEPSADGGAPQEFASPRAPEPRATLERHEACRRAQEALNALEPELREAIVLREIEGLDYRAIGEILKIPLGTVKTRIHRARTNLREKMREFLEPEGRPSVS